MKSMIIFQKIKDFLFFPIRVTIPNEWSHLLGLTSMRQERIKAVKKYLKGRNLDIGCGNNELSKEYKKSYGVDVYPWDNIDLLCDTRNLPFKDGSFNCCTFLASLNHIARENRIFVLKEVKRVLKDDGTVILTMINPVLGTIGHLTLWRWWDPDQRIAGIKKGENFGLWNEDIQKIFKEVGFKLIIHKTFLYQLNNIYVFEKIKDLNL